MSLVYSVQRLKAAEPLVALPTARQLLELSRHIPTKNTVSSAKTSGYSGASPHQIKGALGLSTLSNRSTVAVETPDQHSLGVIE